MGVLTRYIDKLKLIDKLIRQWRVRVALQALPKEVDAVFDIGCDDGYLLRRLDNGKRRLDGCDPRLPSEKLFSNSKILKGFFPSALDGVEKLGPYDAVFALAVFEHFTDADLTDSSLRIAEMLSDRGLLIVTVPHPFVDKILDVLMYLKLIDGQALEEHHGFDPESLATVLSKHLRLKSRSTFQFGLNNIFVFQRI